MSVRLTVKQKGAPGGDKSWSVTLDDEGEIRLGRDQSCEIQLAQMAVSRNHARIFRDGSVFFVEDLGSSYGTMLNGEKLGKGEKEVLKSGAVLAIAQFDVTFERVTEVKEDDDVSNKTKFVSRNLLKDAMKVATGSEHAYFRVMNGKQDGERIELLNAQEYIFGRDASEADIVLNHDLVSRRHAKVRRDFSGTHIEDLGSRNGIKVNKKRARRTTLKDGDEVEIGGVRLLFVDPTDVRDEPVLLDDAPGPDVGEGTVTVAPEPDPEPEPPPPEPEPEPEPPPPEPEEPPPEEGQGDEPPPDEAPPEEYQDGAPPEEGLQEEEFEEEGPRKLIDLRNKQTVVALIVGGLLLLVGLITIILLIAGA